MSDEHQWVEAAEFEGELAAAGWKSPDTYDNCFDEPGRRAGVYVFTLYNPENVSRRYVKCLVAYVGMSTSIGPRWQGHEILRELNKPGYWVRRWFRVLNPNLLREVEADLICRFNPAWNVLGRKRGVDL